MAKKSSEVIEEDGSEQKTVTPAAEVEHIDKTEVLTHVKKMAKKYGKVATIELKQRDPYVPRAIEDKLRNEIMKMKAITANELAAKYDIRVSAVKKLLLNLEDEGILKQIASSSRLKVFNPVN